MAKIDINFLVLLFLPPGTRTKDQEVKKILYYFS
jgi:hypothetical protein